MDKSKGLPESMYSSLTVAGKMCLGTSTRKGKSQSDTSFSADIPYLSDSHFPGTQELPVSYMMYLCLVVLDGFFFLLVKSLFKNVYVVAFTAFSSKDKFNNAPCEKIFLFQLMSLPLDFFI